MVLATFMVQPKCRVHSFPRYRDTVNDPIDALSHANATCLLPPPPPPPLPLGVYWIIYSNRVEYCARKLNRGHHATGLFLAVTKNSRRI